MGSSINWARRAHGLGEPEPLEFHTPREALPPASGSSGTAIERSRRGRAWTPPAEFDNYRLGDRLGMGGMGQVFLAQDLVLDRLVAIKFIQTLKSNPQHRERFLVEARAIARLQHPNVVAIYRVGEVDGQPYLVSEFVRGQSLDLVTTALPWEKVLQIGIGLARGLAAAHRHGVVHRDLKPGNAILTEDGEVKLLDFGLAKLIGDSVSSGSSVSSSSSHPPAPAGVFSAGAALSLTDPGALMGTPHYIPPEVWMGDPGSYRSDVYSLGLILFKLVAGRLPFEQQNIDDLKLAILAHHVPPLASVAVIDARFAEVVDRCLRSDLELRYPSGEELRDALERVSDERRTVVLPEGNPYRGLRPFDAEHRALFFGREADSRAILERLRTDALIVLAGDSGVGKSSLCRAGVLPAILDGALGPDRTWSVLTMIPGRKPLLSFANSLAPLLQLDEEEVTELLREGFGNAARQIRKRLTGKSGLVLLIDQMEELVTTADPAEAQTLARILAELCIFTPGIRLLGSARGDFLTRIASLPALGPEIGRALYLVQSLSGDRIREAVTGPARATGVGFESELLVSTLVESTLSGTGSLPLLQFALAELWERRDAKRSLITEEALRAMGGVTGALATHADRVISLLLPEQRLAARRMLVQLVTLEGTRAHRTEEELTAGNKSALEALEALVRSRLLVARDTPAGPVIEVSHEALIAGWPTLRRWLDEDQEVRAARERLAVAVQDWERTGRTSSALWTPRQVAELARFSLPDLPARADQFLRLSQDHATRRRLWGFALASLVLLAFAVALVAVKVRARYALTQRVNAFINDARSLLASGQARERKALALSAEAFALFDRQRRTDAEKVWAAALDGHSGIDRNYTAATRALDAALMLQGGNSEARSLLADVLLARALLADRDRQVPQRNELLGRLAVYDVGGARREFFNAPGELTVRSGSVTGVRVEGERILSNGPSRRLEPSSDLGEAPAHLSLRSGCYVFRLSADGYASVRVPVCLGRQESLALDIALLRPSSIPPDFVYIPAGRFLFGTTNEDERRDFLDTVPLHPVFTSGYLIQKTETTTAQWLAFLDALPENERAQRQVRAQSATQGGEFSLSKGPRGDWRLSLQPTIQAFKATAAERIHIPARTVRASQDWRKLPMAGISWDESAAFLQWLDTSGKVPGARFCTELEWERAARGADDRNYPHGDTLQPEDANFDETYGKQPLGFGPDEVGSHPMSRSVFGLDDMAGNVWEWTRSAFADHPYVLRGGAWYFGKRASLSTNREVSEPRVHDSRVGLRVCASLPSSVP